MYKKGEQVLYGMHGVCTVTGSEYQTSGGKQVEYLVLEPLHQTGSRFLIPTHNAVAMSRLQRVLEESELQQLFRSAAVREFCWIEDENQRKQTYRELINCGDRVRLMAMVHSLYERKLQQTAAGRKVHLCDENFLRDAEKLLASEVAVVLGLEPDDAKEFIRQHL